MCTLSMSFIDTWLHQGNHGCSSFIEAALEIMDKWITCFCKQLMKLAQHDRAEETRMCMGGVYGINRNWDIFYSYGIQHIPWIGSRFCFAFLLLCQWSLVLARHVFMMTSSNGKIFRVTGHLCGELPGNSPHTGQWRGALVFSLICAWIQSWVNNREAGDLRRYRDHYDVIVMLHIVFRVATLSLA